MCIICNLRDPMNDVDAAMAFLDAYRGAQKAMDRAAEALLAVSKLDVPPEVRRQYDRTHKRMKHIIRDWNMIEHTREKADPGIPIHPTSIATDGIKGLAEIQDGEDNPGVEKL